MADKENLSIEQILAAARKQDGGGAAAPAAPAEEAGSAETAKPAAKPVATAKPGKMSVADMLAAARSSDATGGATASPAAGPAADKPAAPAKKPGAMSVADMLAAARGEKSGDAAAKPAPVEKKPAAKAAPVAKELAAAMPSGPAKSSGPKDTTSILAAARGGAAKPGPITKAEAAARAKEVGVAPVKKKATVPPMPSKPDYAKAITSPQTPTERRSFLVAATAIFAGAFFMTSSLAIGFSSLAVTMLLWVLGTARFMFPNILTEPPTKFKVGFPDEYAPGQVATKFIAQFGVWVARYEYNGQAQIYALQSVCTHLPTW